MKPVSFSQDEYHWRAKAIESLDPETDYEAMWRIMTSYQANDFVNNLIYTLSFPNLIVTPQGGEVIWRDDGGRIVKRAADRVEKTEHYNMTWWNYGPSDERCREAVERINQLHARMAHQYPGRFAHNEDYVYTLCLATTFSHRFFQQLGLPGFTHNEKIAAHHFWRDMAPLFVVEGQGPVTDFPVDFAGCLAFCEEYDARPWAPDERSRSITLAIWHFFSYRYFPPGLRWLGLAVPRTLSLPDTLRNFGFAPPHPFVAALVLGLMKTFFFVAFVLLPDPKIPFIERLDSLSESESRSRKDKITALDKGFAKFHKQNVSVMTCPFASVKME